MHKHAGAIYHIQKKDRNFKWNKLCQTLLEKLEVIVSPSIPRMPIQKGKFHMEGEHKYTDYGNSTPTNNNIMNGFLEDTIPNG